MTGTGGIDPDSGILAADCRQATAALPSSHLCQPIVAVVIQRVAPARKSARQPGAGACNSRSSITDWGKQALPLSPQETPG